MGDPAYTRPRTSSDSLGLETAKSAHPTLSGHGGRSDQRTRRRHRLDLGLRRPLSDLAPG